MSGLSALVRFVSLRHVATSPVRSLLTLMGVALGVAMVVGMTASNGSILASFHEMVDRASGKATLEIGRDEAGVDQEIVETLGTMQEVEHAAPIIEQSTYLRVPGAPGTGGGASERVLVLGVDFLGDLFFLPFERDRGSDVISDPLGFMNDPRAIVISDTLARERGLSPGSKVLVRTAEGMSEFHVEAVLRETGKSKAFGGQVAILSLDAAQLAFARARRADRIDVATRSGVDVDAAAVAIRAKLGGLVAVERPARRGEQVAHMTKSFAVGLQVSALISLFVGMFLIYNSVSVSVAERRREIGILRAVGVTRRRVLAVFLAEAVVLGALGGALGIALGSGLARVVVAAVAPQVSRFYAAINPPPPVVDRSLALTGFVTGLIVTIFAAWMPARAAAATDPVETMRRDIHVQSGRRIPIGKLLSLSGVVWLVVFALTFKKSVLSGFVGIGLVNLAAVLATPAAVVGLHRISQRAAQRWFGLPVRLGLDNVVRHLGRSALTVSALMMATMASVTVAGYSRAFLTSMERWVDQSVPADVIVTAGSPLMDQHEVPFSAGVQPRLEGVAGVDYVDPVKFTTITFRGMRLELLSLGTRNYYQHLGPNGRQTLEGPPPDDGALEAAPVMIVGENVRTKLGVHAGDVVELDSPTGKHPFSVRNVVVDYSSDLGIMIVDRKWYREYWRDERVDAFDFYAKKGASPDAIATEVRRRLTASDPEGAGGLYVMTSRVLKDEVVQAITETFEVTRASEIVALAVAILGVIGTMLSAVLDRIREIGVLRAIGATRRQVVVAVLAEAAFLGVSAALIGIGVAIPCTAVFIDVVGYSTTGWSVPFAFSYVAALRVGAMIVGFSALAGVVPGRHAARLEIPRALAYE